MRAAAERLGPKLLRLSWSGDLRVHSHYCPACEEMHHFAVDGPFHNGARWSYDGNEALPTFAPSMNIGVGPWPDGHVERCHYFLQRGQLQFLGDCTHALRGQTVHLPDIPERLLRTYGIVA